MELTKKTTILFPPDLHSELARKAEREGTSLGELVRRACRAEYGLTTTADRRRAAADLFSLGLPVGSPRAMKEESVAPPEDILQGDDD